MLEAARCVPLAELREQCARAKAASSVDLEVRRARIHQRRSLRSYTDAEGEWHLHCRNNPEVGARIMAALELFREAIFRQARSEDRHEPPEAYAADALTEMARCSADAIAQQTPGPVVVNPTAEAVAVPRASSGPARPTHPTAETAEAPVGVAGLAPKRRSRPIVGVAQDHRAG
ncbi:MAG TPA: hypothetical protein VM942_04580 [Acidimicrobiales bacterium]|nr:hypothetical protein [Acidimicrobiales bacterium]